MEKRIRYVKRTDGSLTSMRVLKAEDGKEYRPIISPDGRTGGIVIAGSDFPVATVRGTSAHKTKIALKRELQKLGVVFAGETRKKSKPVEELTVSV